MGELDQLARRECSSIRSILFVYGLSNNKTSNQTQKGKKTPFCLVRLPSIMSIFVIILLSTSSFLPSSIILSFICNISRLL